jgi:hypothetical protein
MSDDRKLRPGGETLIARKKDATAEAQGARSQSQEPKECAGFCFKTADGILSSVVTPFVRRPIPDQ